MELERIKELLEYNPDTGAITWRKSCGRAKRGEQAGYITVWGYRLIGVDKKYFFAHRVAWLLFYGQAPAGILDHINGDKLDNRIANLRVATKSENAQNVRALRANNKSGFMGVFFVKRVNKWSAQIRVGGKSKALGLFSDPLLAARAYQEAKKVFHPFAV